MPRDRHLSRGRFVKGMKPLLFKVFPRFVALLLPMTPAVLHAEPADELIAKGDSFYVRLQAADALKYYLPAEKLEPNNARLLVRYIARIPSPDERCHEPGRETQPRQHRS